MPDPYKLNRIEDSSALLTEVEVRMLLGPWTLISTIELSAQIPTVEVKVLTLPCTLIVI